MNPQNIDIQMLLPQRPPMVMVDRLLLANVATAETAFTVPADCLFVADGFLQAYALIEVMAQTCAAQAGFVEQFVRGKSAVRVGYIGSVKNLQIEFLPRVGETVVTRMNVLEEVMDMKLVALESYVDDRRIASAELKIALAGEGTVS